MVLEFPVRFNLPSTLKETILAFDPKARFESGLVRGKFFLTSHVFVEGKDAPRVFMLHEGLPDGSIRLVEVLGKSTFDSRKEARRAMRVVLKQEKTG